MKSAPLIAVVALLLAGCALGPPRAVNAPAGQHARLPTDGIITVRPGDNVYVIAQRYGLSQRALIDANGLRPPYLLRPGDRLRVPAALTHVVRSGDTVSEIAETYGVAMRSLVVLNNLRPPYVIHVGERLRLPPIADSNAGLAVASRQPQSVPRRAAPPPRQRSASQPWSGGGQLHFPVTGGGQATASVPVPVPRPSTAASARPRTEPQRQPAARAASQPTRTVSLTPPDKTGRGFAWPVEGRVISGFGPREGGLHNDGINILAPAGTEVRAAENGIVVYAGNELRGFGNLLLVKHAGGYTTAYAHADRLLVGRGDKVTRGQVIATVGQTGNVSTPQLHFEIRKGPRPVDPRKELPAAQVSGLGRD